MANKIWRNVIELSSMQNNEEYVMFTDRQLSYEEVYEMKRLPGVDFSKPRFVCSRPVLEIEIQKGLNTSYRGHIVDFDNDRNEQAPKITRALDELYKLHHHLDLNIQRLGMAPVDAIVNLIEFQVYDCMSSSCSNYYLAALRQIIETQNIPLDTPLYLDGRTIGSFLKDIEEVPRFEKILAVHNIPILPAPMFRG